MRRLRDDRRDHFDASRPRRPHAGGRLPHANRRSHHRMIRAFAFLLWSSWRNRFISQLRRIRSPRYAVALLVGGLYLWWFFFRPTQRVGPAAGMVFLGRPMPVIAIIFVVLSTLGTWVVGSDRTALAFNQAEVALLFP